MSDEPPVLNYASPATEKIGWRTVWTCRNAMEANLAVGALIERGLHARVDTEFMSVVGGTVMPAKVQVVASDVEAARAFLMEIDEQRRLRQARSSVACPQCGHLPCVRRIPMIRHLGSGLCLVTLFLFAPGYAQIAVVTVPLMVLFWLIPVTPRWRCTKCGHRFAAPEPQQPEDHEDDDE